MANFRVEKDSLGEMRVPAQAYYGAQTARAIDNFPVSGLVFPREFIAALGLTKRACARANLEVGGLTSEVGAAIIQAATEMISGGLDEQFVIDIFQTGSGTSTNMNANEVIANRAAEILGYGRGDKVVHPNDHVNMSQSSNDVIPTAINIAAATTIANQLSPAINHLRGALSDKAVSFDAIVKSGRTHLMDATPVRLGQEFGGYAAQISKSAARAAHARDALLDLALGGTAAGTGINRHPLFPRKAIEYLCEDTGLPFREASNHFEAQGARDGCIEASGELKTIACSLMKIANDIRWLASGPRTGLAEITLPTVQPGSSIMPGKANPVICEAVTMVAAQVMGYDATIALCGLSGNFELNVMMPVLAYDLLQSIRLLSSVCRIFADKCITGIQANPDRCRELVERNLATVTALVPRIGYDRAAALSKEAFTSGRTIREVAQESNVLPQDEIDALLDLRRMTEPSDPENEPPD